MSFYKVIEKYKDFDFNNYFRNTTIQDVKKSIHKEKLDSEDLLNLLSPKAIECLEEMAQRANELSIQYFGKVVNLYTPLYLANYCENHCAYCGYNVVNKIHRKKLTLEEVKLEGEAISKQGFKHLLILTGESKTKTPVSYIAECVRVLKPMFPSIGIEVYALTENEYKILVDAGVDGLTIYQETYNEEVYDKVHISGPKKDYIFRLDAPERGAKSGMRDIGLGALLGLSDFRVDAFFTALHGEYIAKKYREVNIAYALPRIRPHEGEFDDINKGKIDIMIKEAKFKSSINFKKIIDEYLADIENNYIPKNDFCYKDYTIMKYNDIDYLFKHTYKMYNFDNRIHEIEKNLISEFKRKSTEIAENLRKERTKAIENLVREERIRVYDEYDKEIKNVEKGYKKIVKNYLNQIPKKDCVQYYKEFIDSYLQNSNEVMQYLKENTLANLNKNEVSFEDLAPIMYIQFKVFGIKDKCKIKHVVIDEAQDYGEFQFDVLKTILNSNSMTILGDIAQGVHYYRGIENWKRFIDVEFNNVKTIYTTLNKTYRTTKEIMDIANLVIDKLPQYEKEYIVLGDPVIDRKNSISIKKVKDKKDLIESINEKINEHLDNGYKSIAIIGKDMKECEMIEREICKLRLDVKLIKGKDSEYNSGISVVPSYLAKGLEFDCVIISNANSVKYTNNSLDIKLLYVTITRAMSKLDIFYEDEITSLIEL